LSDLHDGLAHAQRNHLRTSALFTAHVGSSEAKRDYCIVISKSVNLVFELLSEHGLDLVVLPGILMV